MHRYRVFLILLCILLPINVWSLSLELTDYEGEKHQLSDLKGNWLVLNYWATWCPPCLKEIPMLSDYHDKKKNVKIFGIHYEQNISNDKLDDFKDTYLISYPIIPIDKQIVEEFGMAYALPMTIFISPEGKVVKKYTGMLTEKFIDGVIQ